MNPMGAISEAIRPLYVAAVGYSDALVPLGKQFLAVAFALEMMMLVYAYWAKGGAQQFIAGLVRVLIVTSIPFALLASWDTYTGLLITFFQTNIAEATTKVVDHDALNQAGVAMTQVFQAAVHVSDWTGIDPNSTGMIAGSLNAWTHILAGAAMLILSVYFGIAMLCSVIGPLLLLVVGVIFGPIIVPWLAFKPLASMARKWLQFMVAMGLTFAVALVIMGIAAAGMNGFGDTLTHFGDGLDGIGLLVAAVPMVIVVLFLARVLFHAEFIAVSLTGGDAPVIGGGKVLRSALVAARLAQMTPKSAKSGGNAGKGGSGGAAKSPASLSKGAGHGGGGGGAGKK